MNDHIPDVTKMISDTPRTDEAQFGTGRVSVDFARTLERELNAANVEIERLTKKVAQLYEGAEEQNDRIKRLEEALTEIELAMKQPASNHRLMQISGPARQVINIIKKAKEAKP